METQTAGEFGPDGNNKNDGYHNSYNQNSHTHDPSFHNRGPSRFSDGPPPTNHFPDNGECNNHRDGGGGVAGPFENPPPNPHGGFGGHVGGGFPAGPNYRGPHVPISGQKRSHHMAGRGGFSGGDRFRGGNFAKLFVGSVPKTATEEDIRPLFEKEGNVIEVALVKDKTTGQPQSYCFVKYATSEEADRAIKALHNQHTLPGGNGPIRVRYADGERVRQGVGTTEHKLCVLSLNKQATEKEVEEIFAPYGWIEEVHLLRDEMNQCRGLGFVRYSRRDMALEAISALNGAYTMRGCNRPLTVRFADVKRPKAGDSSFRRGGGPAFEAPGYGSRSQWPMQRSDQNYGESMGDHSWRPISQQNMGPPPNVGVHGPGNQLPPMSGDLQVPFNQGGFGGPPNGAFQGPFIPSTGQAICNFNVIILLDQTWKQCSNLNFVVQNFNQPLHIPPTGHQMPPMQQNSFQSSQHLPPPSFPNTQMPHPAQQNMPPIPSQPLPSQQLPAVSSAAPWIPLPTGSQSHIGPNQPLQSAHFQPQFLQQAPSQSAQTLSQQEQPLQASQQPFSQPQQHIQSCQPARPQWTGMAPQMGASVPASTLASDVHPSTKSAPAAASVAQPATSDRSDWSEHTSPEGNKYYYNCETCESRWEMPAELSTTKQQ
ncbi:Flowering time control protein FCA [Linum grandiflorum]